MTLIVANLVKETTTTTGTGDLTLLGASTGYRAFSAVCADADTVPYAIGDPGDAEREVGLGTWHTGNTLSRTTIFESTNANAAVSLSAGTKKVYLSFPAEIVGLVPSGAAVPTSPQAGMEFLHTPTGRSVLLTYVGGAWKPVASYGSMTLFVDGASGADTANKGTAPGASAYATIQYAIDSIPGTVGGNVTISVAAGTYAENVVILGKNFTGNYSITITGTRTTLDTLTASAITSLQGSGSTQGAVGRSAGTWTVNQRANKMVRFTAGVNSGVTRIIDSNTTTALTVVEVWSGGAPGADNFVVEDWNTIISPAAGKALSIGANQANVFVVDLKFTSVAGTESVATSPGSTLTMTTCTATSTAGAATFGVFSFSGNVTLTSCFFTNTTDGDRIVVVTAGGGLTMDRTKVLAAGAATNYGIVASLGSRLAMSNGCVVDMNGGLNGIEIEASVAVLYTGNSLNRIRGSTVGINALFGATVYYSASATYVVFSGNTSNAVADAATYSSIS